MSREASQLSFGNTICWIAKATDVDDGLSRLRKNPVTIRLATSIPQRQPRSLKGLPAHSVNDEEVDKGVIYLNDLERILGRIFADHWPE
ncbi:hypothetical protein ACOJBO_00920 [Rhizobium beringeri]